jgi:phage baseplate assembly protein W
MSASEFGSNWRLQFADADGIPLNMLSFENIDFGAISYTEIFQNVKTILATPLYSAPLERLLGIDQTIVDLPIVQAAESTVAILDALYFWEPRVEVVNIDFESDTISGHLRVNLQLKIKNVIFGTETPYSKATIYAPRVPPPPIQHVPLAETYLLSGPSSGTIGVPMTFTVQLPPGTTLAEPVLIIPHANVGGGFFQPPNVSLSDAEKIKTFIYTPGTYGTIFISTTNGNAQSLMSAGAMSLTDGASDAASASAAAGAALLSPVKKDGTLIDPPGIKVNVTFQLFEVTLQINHTLVA